MSARSSSLPYCHAARTEPKRSPASAVPRGRSASVPVPPRTDRTSRATLSGPSRRRGSSQGPPPARPPACDHHRGRTAGTPARHRRRRWLLTLRRGTSSSACRRCSQPRTRARRRLRPPNGSPRSRRLRHRGPPRHPHLVHRPRRSGHNLIGSSRPQHRTGRPAPGRQRRSTRLGSRSSRRRRQPPPHRRGRRPGPGPDDPHPGAVADRPGERVPRDPADRGSGGRCTRASRHPCEVTKVSHLAAPWRPTVSHDRQRQ